MEIKKTESKEINFEVIEKCGVISTNGEWSKELRLISWNGRPPKYDIRDWNGERMGKGITLTSDELVKLQEILNS